MAYTFLFILALINPIKSGVIFDFVDELDCKNGIRYNTTLQPLYPGKYSEEYFDDENLISIQDYLEEERPFVTLSVNDKFKLPFGTKVCIPFLNRRFLQYIPFEIRLTTPYFMNRRELNTIEVFVRSERESHDPIFNRKVEIVIEKV